MTNEEIRIAILAELERRDISLVDLAQKMGRSQLHVYRMLRNNYKDERAINPHHLFEIYMAIKPEGTDPNMLILQAMQS